MNLNNIKVGDVYKNYKELCKALEVPVKAGRGKEYQVENFKKDFSFHREGRAYVIDYVGQRLLFDSRGGSSSKRYTRLDMLTDLIIIGLSNQKENTLVINTRNLMQYCGFVNSDFFNNYENYRGYSQKNNLTEEIVKDVLVYSNQRLYQEVGKNLKKLEQRRLIRVNKITIIEREDGTKTRASEDEISILLDAENYALNKMNISDFYKIGFRWNEFAKKASLYAKEHGIEDLVRYYNMKEIILAKESLKTQAEESKKRLIQSRLNSSIFLSFLKGIKNKRKKALENYEKKQFELENCGFGIDVEIKKKSLEIASEKAALLDNYIEEAQKILTDNIIIKNFNNNIELEEETKLDIILSLQ